MAIYSKLQVWAVSKLNQGGSDPLQDVYGEHFLSGAGCRGLPSESASCICQEDGYVQVAEEVIRMESGERVVSGGGDDDDEQHRLRLRALLHEIVRKKGRVEAARVLGLDPRTVGACMDGEGMSWRVREAVERALQEGVGSVAERERRLNQDLERRVEELEGWRAGCGEGIGWRSRSCRRRGGRSEGGMYSEFWPSGATVGQGGGGSGCQW